MGEAFDSETTMGNTMGGQKQTTQTIKERRNGMGHIFDGIDPEVLEKLGLSEEIVHQLNSEADDTFTQCVSQIAEAVKSAGSQQKARTHRSFSTTITSEEMKLVLQNRSRRNAVGNLLELLSSSQRLLLVEHLQEQLARINIVNADINDDSAGNTGNSCDTDLTSPPTYSAMRRLSVTHGQSVCH